MIKKTTEAKQLRSLIGIESHLQSMSGRAYFLRRPSTQTHPGNTSPEDSSHKKKKKKKNGKPFTLTEVIKSPFFDRQRCV